MSCLQTVEYFYRRESYRNEKGGAKSLKTSASPMNISEVTIENEERIPTGIGELDRVLGGGIVKGSLSLVGGDPGIGKSTLLLQVCRNLANNKRKVLYISGKNQCIRSRCVLRELEHLKKKCFFCETDLDAITSAILKTKPEFAVIDSIQTMYSEDLSSAAGSVSQVREVTAAMMRVAKRIILLFSLLDM